MCVCVCVCVRRCLYNVLRWIPGYLQQMRKKQGDRTKCTKTRRWNRWWHSAALRSSRSKSPSSSHLRLCFLLFWLLCMALLGWQISPWLCMSVLLWPTAKLAYIYINVYKYIYIRLLLSPTSWPTKKRLPMKLNSTRISSKECKDNNKQRYKAGSRGTCAVPAGRDCFGDFGGSVPAQQPVRATHSIKIWHCLASPSDFNSIFS